MLTAACRRPVQEAWGGDRTAVARLGWARMSSGTTVVSAPGTSAPRLPKVWRLQARKGAVPFTPFSRDARQPQDLVYHVNPARRLYVKSRPAGERPFDPRARQSGVARRCLPAAGGHASQRRTDALATPLVSRTGVARWREAMACLGGDRCSAGPASAVRLKIDLQPSGMSAACRRDVGGPGEGGGCGISRRIQWLFSGMRGGR